MTLLVLEGLTKHFGATPALEGFSLTVEAGRRTAIVGPSGSGKTTLLRLVAGFETPDAGRITLGDAVLAQAGWAMPAHRRPIGLVSQDGALFPHLDIRDNIGFGLDRKLPGRDRRVGELMDLVELDRAMLDRRPHQLSGGQQQRVALARALARRPRLMLLDEPFSALDAGLRDSLRRKVMDILHGQGVASILVTHDQEEALIFADQLVVLRDARLQQAGSPRQLYLEPKDAATAAFLGAAILIEARIEPGGWAVSALGRFQIEGAGDEKSGTLLIRPEQIELCPADPQPTRNSSKNAPVAQVMKLEFAGPLCRLRLDLESPSDTLSSLTVQVPSTRAPGLGDRVAIVLLGAPHLLRG